MLVLSLKEGDEVRVGDSKVSVLRIKGREVRVGFDFPRAVFIDRVAREDVGRDHGVDDPSGDDPTRGRRLVDYLRGRGSVG